MTQAGPSSEGEHRGRETEEGARRGELGLRRGCLFADLSLLCSGPLVFLGCGPPSPFWEDRCP